VRIVKWIDEGSIIPRLYGVAWRNYYPRYEVACLPVPLNKVVFHSRSFWYWLKCAPAKVSKEELFDQLRSVGKELSRANNQAQSLKNELEEHRRYCLVNHIGRWQSPKPGEEAP
jgi:hypothetical protein